MRGRWRRGLVVNAGREAAVATTEAEPLAAFDAANRGEWWWLQPKWSRRAWRLEVDGRPVAALRGEAIFSNLTRVRFAGHSYEVRRGFLGHASLRAEGAEATLAKFTSTWMGGGRIETASGERLALAPIGFWQRTYELRTDESFVLARFESHDSLVRHHVRIEFEDAARRRDDLQILVALVSAMVFAPKRHSH